MVAEWSPGADYDRPDYNDPAYHRAEMKEINMKELERKGHNRSCAIDQAYHDFKCSCDKK